MDAARSEGLGTVWFMVTLHRAAGLVLERRAGPYLAAAAMMALTWGDAAAALVGRAWGRHRYRIGGQTRSLEGSAALAVATLPQRHAHAGAAGARPTIRLGRALRSPRWSRSVAALLEPAAPRRPGQPQRAHRRGRGALAAR